MPEKKFNHPNIVRNEENPEQALLMSSLQNCGPYVFPGTVDFHLAELIKHAEDDPDFNIENLNEKLTELVSLRVVIDQPNARKNKKKFSELLDQITLKANEINSIAHYTIITNPKLISDFRHEASKLLHYLNKSGYIESVKIRMRATFEDKIRHTFTSANFKYSNEKLPGEIAKLKKVNDSFDSKNLTLFIDALKQELNLNTD